MKNSSRDSYDKKWMLTILVTVMMLGCEKSALGESSRLKEATFFRVESVDQISVHDLWHMSFVGSLQSSTFETLKYWRHELQYAAPYQGERLISLVLVGSGVVGETPVGVRIWAQNSARVARAVVVPAADAATFEITLRQNDCGEHTCITKKSIITVTNSNVYIDNMLIGSIQ